MKIIAFFTHEYPNGYSPMSYRLHYYMKALILKGVEVEIVIPSNQDREGGIHDEVPYSYAKTEIESTRFSSRKAINEYKKIVIILAKRCDVIFVSLDDSAIFKLSKAVHSVGGKIAIEMNENPHSIIGGRRDLRPILYLKRAFFLKYSLPNVDGIITISHALYDLISKYKSKEAAIVRIPILSGVREFKQNKSYDGTPFILHAGALSEQKDGVKAMLRSFLIAHKKLNGNIKFFFTNKMGLPSLLSWIDNFIHKNELENHVEFKGIVSKAELEKLYNNCSLAIINKPSNCQNDYNFPTKLTELLPREIPVILSQTGELIYYFKDNENAYMVEADNIEQIAKQIIYILTHPKETEQVTQNARLLAEKEFYYPNYADELFTFFNIIMDHKKSTRNHA